MIDEFIFRSIGSFITFNLYSHKIKLKNKMNINCNLCIAKRHIINYIYNFRCCVCQKKAHTAFNYIL